LAADNPVVLAQTGTEVRPGTGRPHLCNEREPFGARSLCIFWTKPHKTHLYKPSCALTKAAWVISVNTTSIEYLFFLIIFLSYSFWGDAELYNEE